MNCFSNLLMYYKYIVSTSNMFNPSISVHEQNNIDVFTSTNVSNLLNSLHISNIYSVYKISGFFVIFISILINDLKFIYS